MLKFSDEIESLSGLIDGERVRTGNMDKETRKYIQIINELESQLQLEREKAQSRDRNLDDLLHEKD